MNITVKTVLTSALLTAVIAGTSANAGRAELPSFDNDNIVVTAAEKVFLNTSGGMAQQSIAYADSVSIKKVSFQAPVANQEINR